MAKTKDRLTDGSLKMAEPFASRAAFQTCSHLSTMINNPWINRAAVIVLMLCVYIAGVDSGTKANHEQPVCQPALKP